eukprot:662591-Pelagomonas_calceolata.AAC.5
MRTHGHKHIPPAPLHKHLLARTQACKSACTCPPVSAGVASAAAPPAPQPARCPQPPRLPARSGHRTMRSS